jgi:hypothetical protein
LSDDIFLPQANPSSSEDMVYEKSGLPSSDQTDPELSAGSLHFNTAIL